MAAVGHAKYIKKQYESKKIAAAYKKGAEKISA